MLKTRAATTVSNMEWYEICEWNAQDATSTLEHIGGLLALWTTDVDVRSPEAAAACDRIENISQSWREHHDQPALAVELWAQLVALHASRTHHIASHSGTVAQINRSTGGVPKSAVDTAPGGTQRLFDPAQSRTATW